MTRILILWTCLIFGPTASAQEPGDVLRVAELSFGLSWKEAVTRFPQGSLSLIEPDKLKVDSEVPQPSLFVPLPDQKAQAILLFQEGRLNAVTVSVFGLRALETAILKSLTSTYGKPATHVVDETKETYTWRTEGEILEVGLDRENDSLFIRRMTPLLHGQLMKSKHPEPASPPGSGSR